MAATMTLEQVLLEARLVANNGCVSITRKNCAEWADAIDAAIKQREWGANNPLKGWIFDKLAEALRDATYVAGMLDAICETDGTVDHMQARDAAFRVRDALQAHTAEDKKAEAELAALKARIANSPIVEIANYGDPFIVLPDHFTVPNSLKGKRVRLVVEE